MLRALVTVVALAAGVAAGLYGGFTLWGRDAARTKGLETQVETLRRDVATLAQQRDELAGRIDVIAKEQERLAAENERLRQEHTEEQLLGGAGHNAPFVLPPK